MKKTIAILLTALICLSLTACDPGTFIIEDTFLEGIVRAELIQYENGEQKHFVSWVPNQFDKLVPFEESKATLIETLNEEKLPLLLAEFQQSHILHTYYAYNSPKDVCIRLTYENGNYLIIWADYNRGSFAGYIGEYLPDGIVYSFWGSFSSLDDYLYLVNTFFETQLSYD